MTITNAIKKMSKYGKVNQNGQFYTVNIEDYVLEVSRNGRDDEVATINVRRSNDHSDVMSDYFAGSYFDNLSQALRFVEGR